MKTTFDIPEQLLRATKSAAALRGQSMKDFVRAALEERCRAQGHPAQRHGWKSVFGKVRAADAARIDAVIDKEFSRVDEASWR